MDLKDLANEERGTNAVPAPPATLVAAAKDSCPAGPPGVRWLVLESKHLDDEQFLVVFEKKHLKEARKAHPGKVIYFPPEIDELHRHKDAPDYPQFLKSIHLIKKKFGGWIVPSDSPLARRLDRANRPAARGGDSHGAAKSGKRAG
ncbi:MAG: hypothetical protein HYU36_08735 [Planctomycetes bacterium]|nr:hypothetical protein [Planctomycetota bacterium]